MLHILLLILKIIGLLFLILIGAALMVILLILFVPLRYRGNFEFDGKLKGDLFASWLFRFFTIQVDLKDETEVTVKILWFRLFKKNEAAEDGVMEEETLEPETLKSEKPEAAEKPNSPVKTVEAQKNQTRIREPEVQAFEDKKRKTKKAKPKFLERIRLFFKKQMKKIKTFFRLFQDKKKSYDKIREFIENEENQKALRLFLHHSKRMFRHIFPRKLEGSIRFGFEDPYLTGKILTAVSPFYGFYGDKLAVEPVFDENVLKGNVHIKGQIRQAVLIWSSVCLFRNKKLRKLYHAVRG